MGDAADDLYAAAEREEALHATLRKTCPKNSDRPCNWNRNDDGLLECLTCGNVIDE